VNPSSCSGLTGRDWDALYLKIKPIFGGKPKVVFTRRPGDGTMLTRGFLKKGFKTVAALGGDGTINEVANGFFEDPVGIHRDGSGGKLRKGARYPSPLELRLINPDAAMAIVPCGTRNVLAKSLGLPEGAVECCRAFSAGTPRKIDVISATVTDRQDRTTTSTTVFLNAAEIGLGAEIIDKSKKVRKAVNSRLVSTIAGIVSTLPTYQSNNCEVSLDNNGVRKKFTANMTMAIVANGSYLGGDFNVAPHAKMSDGLLDVVIVKDSGSFKLLDELANMKEGDYSREDKIYYKQATRVSLRSKERDVSVTVDGEPIGILPATFEIIDDALKISI
jgi:diacylglycerol kinase (ATP)